MMDFSTQRLDLVASNGSTTAASLDIPNGVLRAQALFAHGFFSGNDPATARHLSAELAKAGIAVLRFDSTELGIGDGDLTTANLSSATSGILSAVDYLRANYQAPSLLLGHSLAGAAALAVANQIPELAAIAVIGAPSIVGGVLDQLDVSPRGTHSKGIMQAKEVVGASDTNGHVCGLRLLEAVACIQKPLLVLHSPVDEIVGIRHATKIFAAAKHPKSFISLGKTDHFLTTPEDAAFAGRVISGWLSQFLDPCEPQAITPSKDTIVKETGQGKFQTFVISGKHQMLADEPQKVGGLNSGPSPYDFLSAALGACTSMTLRQYADFKNIPLGRISVRVAHAKLHARDCAECTETERAGGGRIDRFEREISVEGDVSEELRKKFVEIADRCPVHRTLERSARVVTTVR